MDNGPFGSATQFQLDREEVSNAPCVKFIDLVNHRDAKCVFFVMCSSALLIQAAKSYPAVTKLFHFLPPYESQKNVFHFSYYQNKISEQDGCGHII